MSGTGEATPSPQRRLFEWVHGRNTASSFTFFTQLPPFELRDLQAALMRAVDDISDRLDHRLENTMIFAKEDQHCIELDEAEFFMGRMLRIHELQQMGNGVASLNRARVVQLLEMCRDEIEWEENEIKRLEVHCEVAREQKALGHRHSFQYRPLPRRDRVVVPGIGAFGVDDRKDSALYQHRRLVGEDEDEDLMDMEVSDDEEMQTKEERADVGVKKEEQSDAIVKKEEWPDVDVKEEYKHMEMKRGDEQQDIDMEGGFVKEESP